MKILHTADLHLDSAFCGEGELAAERRRERQREVLRKIFEVAKTQECDMILVAGDFFDTSYVTPETRSLCLSLFESFGKPIVIAPGNHDPFIEGSFWRSELPENVYVFTSTDIQYLDFPELSVTVGGYAFVSSALSQNPLEGQARIPEDGSKWHILCAHCDLDLPTSRYAPVRSADIEAMGFDYAALGHVHNPQRGTEGKIRYCGFPEGRSFDERGHGGVLILSDDGGELEVTFHRISESRYVCERIDVDGMSTPEEIEAALRSKIAQSGAEGTTYARIELCGVIPEGAMCDLDVIKREQWQGIGSVEITDNTLCLPEGEYLERDSSLRGEFYRSLSSLLLGEDAEQRQLALRALHIGLAAIDGKSFTEGGAI